MKEYDKAWAKYQENLSIMSLPLISWEYHQLNSLEAILFKRIQRNWQDQTNFLKKAKMEKREIIVTDKNFMIIFASDNIEVINGFKPNEIIGKSPKMFQGKDTTVQSRENIQKAVKNLEPFKEVIINYDKNGEKYCCEIEAYPKFSKEGEFLNYIAFERVA
jgi:PAS domain S-box-containing protein